MTDREKLISLMEDKVREITCWGGEMLYLLNPEKLADHLLANGVTVQQMTPITEDIPHEECLAVNDSGDFMVGKIVKDHYSTVTGYACMLDDAGIEVGIEDVTRWQPLPELPKGGMKND